jgi:hypothetical protein
MARRTQPRPVDEDTAPPIESVFERASETVQLRAVRSALELSFLPLTNARHTNRSSDSDPSTLLRCERLAVTGPGFAATTLDVDDNR